MDFCRIEVVIVLFQSCYSFFFFFFKVGAGGERWALSFNLLHPPSFFLELAESVGHLLLKGNPSVKQGLRADKGMPYLCLSSLPESCAVMKQLASLCSSSLSLGL